jgi:hypothetical protein
MALVIPPNYSQAVFRWGLAGDAETMVNTLGLDTTSVTLWEALVDSLAANTRTSLPVSVILTGYSFQGVTLYRGQDGGPPAVYESPAVTHAGTNAGPPLPPNCAFLLRKRTALGGRKGRGRMFIPAGVGVGEDSVPSTGVLLEAQRAPLATRYNDWINSLGPSPVLFHDSATPGSTAPTPITSFTLEARLATVRRRLRP